MKKDLIFAAILIAAGAQDVSAAILTQIPPPDSMAMPMVSYQASDGMIHVMMPGAVPQLTPLLVSNPGDSFDPADPWFNALDPSAQGASFSRHYGFMMDAMSDPLPANTQMWIRKLAGPADLKIYNYSSSVPKQLTPVFGTDGSTNAVYWKGMMWHPVVAAPPGTNSYTATFEVYLVNTANGQEVADTSIGTLTFNWTNVSDGRPALNLAQKIVVAWPSATATNWVLEATATVNAATWNAVTNAPVTVDGQPSVILDQNAAQQFFRMRFVP
ncbi:MAG: hypothetical protein WCJ07_00880 [Verrucomicrobiota bacterium]